MTVDEGVFEVVRKQCMLKPDFPLDANIILRDDGFCDEFDLACIAERIERKFDVQIEGSPEVGWITLGDIIEYVQRLDNSSDQ